jgi:uncharacterized protein
MLLDFSTIPEQGLTLDGQLELTEPDASGRGPLVRGPVRLTGRARHGRRGVELHGELDATARLECSRCLEPFEMAIRAEFFLILVSEAREFGLGEKRLALEDATLFYADRGRADLREICREQIYLNLPLKPVCRGECAGLCPTCGANRNRIECRCRPAQPDPRLAPLLAFKNKKKGDGRRS